MRTFVMFFKVCFTFYLFFSFKIFYCVCIPYIKIDSTKGIVLLDYVLGEFQNAIQLVCVIHNILKWQATSNVLMLLLRIEFRK